jgi:hypothetical protein
LAIRMRTQIVAPLVMVLLLAACQKQPPVQSPAVTAAPVEKAPEIDGAAMIRKWDAGQPEIPSNLVAVALWQEAANNAQAVGEGWVGCKGQAAMVAKSASSSSIEGIKQVGYFGLQFTKNACTFSKDDEAKLIKLIKSGLSASLAANKQSATQPEIDAAALTLMGQLKGTIPASATADPVVAAAPAQVAPGSHPVPIQYPHVRPLPAAKQAPAVK